MQLNTTIPEEILRVKKVKRLRDRALEKYDSVLCRHAALSKAKEASALVEEAFIVFESRKSYLKASLDLTQSLISFKSLTDHIIPHHLLTSLEDFAKFHQTCANVLVGAVTELRLQEEKIVNVNDSVKNIATELERDRSKIEIDIIKAILPDPSESILDDSMFSIDQELLKVLTAEKEGYLFRKKTAVGSSWARRYCKVENGNFYCFSLSASGKHKGFLMSYTPIHLMKCLIRISRVDDRRYCFELVTPRSSDILLLQAETYSDLRSWINVISASTYQSSLDSSLVIVDPIPEDKDEQGEDLSLITGICFSNSLEMLPELPSINNQSQDFGKEYYKF